MGKIGVAGMFSGGGIEWAKISEQPFSLSVEQNSDLTFKAVMSEELLIPTGSDLFVLQLLAGALTVSGTNNQYAGYGAVSIQNEQYGSLSASAEIGKTTTTSGVYKLLAFPVLESTEKLLFLHKQFSLSGAETLYAPSVHVYLKGRGTVSATGKLTVWGGKFQLPN